MIARIASRRNLDEIRIVASRKNLDERFLSFQSHFDQSSSMLHNLRSW